MIGYPRALAARHDIARAVAAWSSAEPTAEPVARAPAPPNLARLYPRAPSTAEPVARAPAPPNLARLYPRAPSTAEPVARAPAPPIPLRTVPSTDPNRRYRRALAAAPRRASGRRTRYAQLPRRPNKGQPNLIGHPFEFAGPDRTPVRPNKCSNLHPANLGKVTRITGNRFHSPERFKMLGGSFQSRTLLAGLKVESNTRSIAHLFDGSRG